MAVIMLGASSPGSEWPLFTLLAWAGLTGAVAGGLLGLALAWFSVSVADRPVSSRVMMRALRGGWSRRLGGSFMGLRVTGRISGATYELPVMYVAHGDARWVMVGRSATKTWWRNISRSTRVEVLHDGRWVPATVDLVTPTDPGFLNGLAWYMTRWPQARPAPEDPMVRLRVTVVSSGLHLGTYDPAPEAGAETVWAATTKE